MTDETKTKCVPTQKERHSMNMEMMNHLIRYDDGTVEWKAGMSDAVMAKLFQTTGIYKDCNMNHVKRQRLEVFGELRNGMGVPGGLNEVYARLTALEARMKELEDLIK